MSETRGTEVAKIVARAQKRIEGMLADAHALRRTEGLRERLREERDTLSRIAVAIRGLSPDHLTTLKTHVDEFTHQDGVRFEKVESVIAAILQSTPPPRSLATR